MKKISFNGKEYIRASEIAKKFRYTQDYVGQLCRSKKVDARLVGRNWYVVADSVSSYRKTKHATQKKDAAKKDPAPKARSPRSKKRLQVEPVLRAKTLRVAKQGSQAQSVHTAYSSDATATIPVLKPDQVSSSKAASIKVKKRTAVAVPVASEQKKSTKFSSEKLPEIALSGKLSVIDSDLTASSPQEESVPEKKSVLINKSSADGASSTKEEKEAVVRANNPKKHNLAEDFGVAEQDNVVAANKNQSKQTFTPNVIKEKTKSSDKPLHFLLWPSVAALVACLLGLLLLGLGSEVVVWDSKVSETWTVSSLEF